MSHCAGVVAHKCYTQLVTPHLTILAYFTGSSRKIICAPQQSQSFFSNCLMAHQ
jgi:hypothetical protein